MTFIRTFGQSLEKIDLSPLPRATADPSAVQNVLTIAFGLLAAVAVMFIIIGGFRYVAAQGDPQAAVKARGTIVYAIVGLIIAIFSVTIVTFVSGRL